MLRYNALGSLIFFARSHEVSVTEIAPDVYRISTFVPEIDLQFNQFLIKDDEPLLFHTGMNVLFPAVHEAVATIIDPSRLRWISFSHFEADECGSLNQWLQIAPNAQAVCSLVGALLGSCNAFRGDKRDIVLHRPLPSGR